MDTRNNLPNEFTIEWFNYKDTLAPNTFKCS
jgi:hypothetical protein